MPSSEFDKELSILKVQFDAFERDIRQNVETLKQESHRRDDELKAYMDSIKADFQEEIRQLRQNDDNMQRDYSSREFAKNNKVVSILVGLLTGILLSILGFFLTNLGGK